MEVPGYLRAREGLEVHRGVVHVPCGAPDPGALPGGGR